MKTSDRLVFHCCCRFGKKKKKICTDSNVWNWHIHTEQMISHPLPVDVEQIHSIFLHRSKHRPLTHSAVLKMCMYYSRAHRLCSSNPL